MEILGFYYFGNILINLSSSVLMQEKLSVLKAPKSLLIY